MAVGTSELNFATIPCLETAGQRPAICDYADFMQKKLVLTGTIARFTQIYDPRHSALNLLRQGPARTVQRQDERPGTTTPLRLRLRLF